MKTIHDLSLLREVQILARKAGEEILAIYQSGDWAVSAKSDDSPLTQADLVANEIILAGLKKVSSEPIVSEESDPHLVQVNNKFWLVDPLDGTRDFIARHDTFVVSIGLVENGYPILGVIYSPVLKRTWWASLGNGAFAQTDDSDTIEKLFNDSNRHELVAAGSRSLASDQMQKLFDHLEVKEVQRFGSALKFCRLAEGHIDLYPRFGPMHEWDTAAGQIIVEEAGCKVIEVSSGERLRYAKPGFAHRGGFIASRSDLDPVIRVKKLRA
jgi:3'(2'), 5'-bisphosphate nucleotidase